MQIYRPGHGFAWLTRKQADAAVAKGQATWIEDARTREMVCHFIDLRVEYRLDNSPSLPPPVEGKISDAFPDMPVLGPAPTWLKRMGYEIFAD